jgi:hypothetical protein
MIAAEAEAQADTQRLGDLSLGVVCHSCGPGFNNTPASAGDKRSAGDGGMGRPDPF